MNSLEALRVCNIQNPFNAPVYHAQVVSSTMDVSRKLALKGEPGGTVIAADFQETGRGRIQDRKWQTENKMSLLFTIFLRYKKIDDIPAVLTLKAGLAVSDAIAGFSEKLKGLVKIKWPNDIMINSKKAAGILCESDGENVYIGIGLNMRQKEFPDHLREKATSFALAGGMEISETERFLLLEKILTHLYNELQNIKEADGWKSRLNAQLYKKGEQVTFMEGAAGSGREVKGVLCGIGDSGELLIAPNNETAVKSFITGELKTVPAALD